MAIGVAYYAAALGCAALVEAGWPKALYLLFLLFLVNSIKFILHGLWSLLMLARVRFYERRLRKQTERLDRAVDMAPADWLAAHDEATSSRESASAGADVR